MSDAARPRDADNHTSMELYGVAAHEAAAVMLRRYSSSFTAGARLLGDPQRAMIEDIYGLVRLADEIVDTYRGDDAGELLDALEADTYASLARGYSTNVIVHAFADTASATGIGRDQVEPFFASMRMDLRQTVHDQESFERYVFGSAEVVGEMCLLVFLSGSGRSPSGRAITGARRLGSAYQKVNFLRDLATDSEELGRTYFPGVTAESLDDDALAELVADCAADLDAARACLDELPRRPRTAVLASIEIYGALLRKIARTPAPQLLRARIRVSGLRKVILTGKAVAASAVRR